VVTVYDMINELFPESFPAADDIPNRKRVAVTRADHVICISETTRNDLLALLPVDPGRVSVVHLGFDVLSPGRWSSESLVGARPYLLYVGLRGGYKNFSSLLTAYARSENLRREYGLVCFGGGPFTADEIGALDRAGIVRDRVIHVAGGDDRLAALYMGASALVYPSRYEGFGIPPLEAMALSCPVVCSRAPAVREILGDAVEYFDAHDSDGLTMAMESVVSSPSRRAELLEKGRQLLERYSWRRCAMQTAEVYRSLMS
jgi:glycosyltransferase involved in cell wall biosynthesis